MLKALYYPNTEIQNPTILKNALLLWDKIETIVPRPDWRPRGIHRDKSIQEAIELVVANRVPSIDERREAHRELANAIDSGFAAALIKNAPRTWINPSFLIYAEKFPHETWRILERGGMAHWVEHRKDYRVPPALGFLMMSILADSCAGTQIQKVTDRVEAYSWIAQQRATALGSPYVTGFDVSQVAPAYDRLVTLSLEVLDARHVPLDRLVEFRKRETKRGGAEYSSMRRRYLKILRAHLERIGKQAKTKNDVREIEQQFKSDINEDLTELKAELRLASLRTLFSKEVALSAIILAGSLTAPVAGLTALATQLQGIGVVPLLKAAVEYRGARREALQKHAMSWLFLCKQPPLTLY